MLEAKKCARCGTMYVSEMSVCGKCQQKDGADIYKLKGFFEKELGNTWSEIDISRTTGISKKNLQRFLNYDEFKGVGVELGKGVIAVTGIADNDNGKDEVLV